ncbi:MAG TPA: molybdopterin-dependent oxidoreductase [Blastocatellia bacterium]|nr:molybdopterin-dependent oxidoreductase [Blastocatellia bacterium]
MDILKLDLQNTGPEQPSESEVRFQVALLAALACAAASFIARFVFDAPLVPELLAHFIFAVMPISVIEVGVGLLGPFAKRLAFVGCVVLYIIALLGAALAFIRYSNKVKNRAPARLMAAAFTVLVWAVFVFLVIPLLGGGVSGRYLRQGPLFTALSLLAVFAVYGIALSLVSAIYIERPEVARVNNYRLSRRRFIRGIGYAVVAVAAYEVARSFLTTWWRSGSGRVKNGDGVFPNIDGLAMEVTPTDDFYVVSKNPFDPQVDTARWRLEVTGLVENPLTLTYEDLKGLPAVEQYATLECIDNKVGGDLIGNALWRGVRLKDVLEKAGLKDGVVDIALRASDDYRDSIPLDRALADGSILAYEMNGAPLTEAHGYPLRLIVPGIYGMKNVKWIKRIEPVNFDLKGYWQARGWDDRAEYKTESRIDTPDEVDGAATIAGVAFAGDRGISGVEVSTDGGKSWAAAEVKPALSRYSWALWHKEWRPEAAGTYSVVARAIDGDGVTQTDRRSPVSPDGASGRHTVRIVVN